MSLREDANVIIGAAIKAALPDTAVKNALASLPAYKGKLVLVAIGKAAWQMANAVYSNLSVDSGIVVTKHGHSKGAIGNLIIKEASHPVPDETSYKATQEAIDVVSDLSENDLVLFLISGGGSALFEKPLISDLELQDITKQLLACGADITEINTIRKRLSAVKGGKFAEICSPAKVFSIVLSDIVGDPLDMIASGPAYPDSTTAEQAFEIVKKYDLKLSDEALCLLKIETPKSLSNVTTVVTGSVTQLCAAAEKCCVSLGYKPVILRTDLCCEAKVAGADFGRLAIENKDTTESLAFIAGGETVVKLTGTGLGGRNQELALSAAQHISGLLDTAVFSVGSDGTDGPTDAAGGYVDGDTKNKLSMNIKDVLKNNDAYHALREVDGLIFTGPTGTNVNDLSVLLIKR